MGIEEEFSKFTHQVEEKFHDVKEHVIMSVERHSFIIAFVLMTVTSAILLVGTVYVWCYHGNRNYDKKRDPKRQGDDGQKKKVPKDDSKKGDNQEMTDSSKGGASQVPEEQNDKVRKRIPSQSSSNVNNNESPVKSKIPVRARVKSTSP